MFKFTAKLILIPIFAMIAMTHAKAVLAAGDPVAGKQVYEEECSECHSIQGKNKKGPTLTGVFGRKAGTVADYPEYSDGMKNSGIVWAEDKLDQYLTMPRKFVPGAKMKYEGLADAKARADLIAFITTLK
jgi:cytochrome c